jgi:hypothetical protein
MAPQRPINVREPSLRNFGQETSAYLVTHEKAGVGEASALISDLKQTVGGGFRNGSRPTVSRVKPKPLLESSKVDTLMTDSKGKHRRFACGCVR